jgi:hypothetical protein
MFSRVLCSLVTPNDRQGRNRIYAPSLRKFTGRADALGGTAPPRASRRRPAANGRPRASDFPKRFLLSSDISAPSFARDEDISPLISPKRRVIYQIPTMVCQLSNRDSFQSRYPISVLSSTGLHLLLQVFDLISYFKT